MFHIVGHIPVSLCELLALSATALTVVVAATNHEGDGILKRSNRSGVGDETRERFEIGSTHRRSISTATERWINGTDNISLQLPLYFTNEPSIPVNGPLVTRTRSPS